MSGLFITATGTDIGKTYITACLLRALKESYKLMALKPVISGFDMHEQTDAHQLLKASAKPATQKMIEQMSPFRYQAPLSPDMAAQRESKRLDDHLLLDFCRNKLEEQETNWLIEGVGGVMVPLNERYTVLDWMDDLKLPVLLVTGSYLGSLSHTLTAYQALKSRQMDVAAIIVNESGEPQVGCLETINSLKPFIQSTPLMAWTRHQSRVPDALMEILKAKLAQNVVYAS